MRLDYHTPALSQSDRGYLRNLFDILLSTDTKTSCSSSTETKFVSYRDGQYENTYFKSREGVISFLNKILESDSFMNTQKLWKLSGEGKFIDMMRHILTDYYQNHRRSVPN
ncbi:hypothetical protein MFLAVUS_000522 [Mucor flavus]|uniref:LAGLIDADG endonuclease n=1 Tax=Mucor flavus TaxID=439312 RepID=A0ABP9YJZ0_9FUNG